MSHNLGCKEFELYQVPDEIALWCIRNTHLDHTNSWKWQKANVYWIDNVFNKQGVMMAEAMVGYVCERFNIYTGILAKYISYLLTLPGAITERKGKYGDYKYIDPTIFNHIRKLLTIKTLTWYKA